MDRKTDTAKQNNLETVDDEIHKKLFHWFEERGLLLELRAHMRQQMVRALQQNVTGLNGYRKRSSNSPKFQAMHMLIADFLLQQEHHYTVSVFSTEVPILNSLPEFSTYIAQVLEASKECVLPVSASTPRFSTVDIQDILETLGLPPRTQIGAYAAELYGESGEALLTCIVRALSALYGVAASQSNFPETPINFNSARQLSNDSNDETFDGSDPDTEHWTSEMRGILLQSDVKIRHINKLQEKMRKFHENELVRIRQEEASKYEVLRIQQEAELENRLREEISREYTTQETELDKQRNDLHSLALQLHAEHNEVTERLSQLQIQSNEVEEQKNKQDNETLLLEELKNEIDLQQKQINESYTRLVIDQENFRREQEAAKSHQMESNVDETDDQEFRKIIQEQYSVINQKLEETKEKLNDHDNVLVLHRSLNTNTTQTEMQDLIDREQQTSFSLQPDSVLLNELQLERETGNQLQEENIELRAFVLQQRCRIDEVTHRAAVLATQLEEAQRSITDHVCQDRIIAVPPAPIIPPRSHPPLMHQTRPYLHWQPRRTGAGEESFFTPRQVVPQQSPNRHELRRRPLRFNCSQNISSTSEESSPTDEILCEARRRLRDLEEQSEVVNRSFRQFQARQLEQSNTLILNRNIPNNLSNRFTNYISSPSVAQIPYPRSHGFNHPRLQAQTTISEEDSDDDDFVNSRRPAVFTRHRNITNRCFVPSDSPMPSRRLYFTNFKHISRYSSFKKKYGKSPASKNTNEQKGFEYNLDLNQSERLERRTSGTESQAFQIRRNRQKSSSSGSSSDSDSCTFFNRYDTQKYRTSKVVLRPSRFKKAKCIVENKQMEVENTSVDKSENLKVNNTKVEKENTREQTVIENQGSPLPRIVMNPLSSAISSGSLAVESIPRDEYAEHVETLRTNLHTLIKSNKPVEADINVSTNINQNGEVPVNECVRSTTPPVEDLAQRLVEPLSLTVPNVNLFNDCNISQTNAFGELERHGDENNVHRQTSTTVLSVTSASDIFRELEISQSEPSDDVISAPLEQLSKHSSDFWE